MTHKTDHYVKATPDNPASYEVVDIMCDVCERSESDGLTMTENGIPNFGQPQLHICNECIDDKLVAYKVAQIGMNGLSEYADAKLMNQVNVLMGMILEVGHEVTKGHDTSLMADCKKVAIFNLFEIRLQEIMEGIEE